MKINKILRTLSGAEFEGHVVKDQKELLKKVQQGEFTIRDLRGQFESILKLGSLNSFLSLLHADIKSFQNM